MVSLVFMNSPTSHAEINWLSNDLQLKSMCISWTFSLPSVRWTSATRWQGTVKQILRRYLILMSRLYYLIPPLHNSFTHNGDHSLKSLMILILANVPSTIPTLSPFFALRKGFLRRWRWNYRKICGKVSKSGNRERPVEQIWSNLIKEQDQMNHRPVTRRGTTSENSKARKGLTRIMTYILHSYNGGTTLPALQLSILAREYTTAWMVRVFIYFHISPNRLKKYAAITFLVYLFPSTQIIMSLKSR